MGRGGVRSGPFGEHGRKHSKWEKRVNKRIGGFVLEARHEILLKRKGMVNSAQCEERAGRTRAGKRPLDLTICLTGRESQATWCQ